MTRDDMALDKLDVVTLFVEDLASTRAFYEEIFGLPVVSEDEVSAVVKLRNVMINLLQASEAQMLIEPMRVAGANAWARLLFTIEVDDIAAICAQLQRRGVTLLNGPIDRPWGRRTAAFADPAGNVWEIAQVLHEVAAG